MLALPLLAAAYLLFAGQPSPHELAAGAGCLVLLLPYTLWLRHCRHRPLSARPLRNRAAWRTLVHAIAALGPDTASLFLRLPGTLLRRTPSLGETASIPFQEGPNSAEAATRRALVTLALSLSPGGYVIAIEDGANALLLRRLRGTQTPRDPVWPA